MASHPTKIAAVLLASTIAVGAGAVAVSSFVAPTAAEATTAPSMLAELGPEALAGGPSSVVAGNSEGDVTLIEYFDYQCPVCRRVHPAVKQLAAEDKGVRIIHKHWPVFGGSSIYAAKLALAARWQDRYEQVHDAFMAIQGRLDDGKIRKAAGDAGLDLARAERDLKERDAQIDAAFKDASAQAAMLQLRGTPGFVIGNYIVPGGLDLKAMQEIVAEIRTKWKNGGQG